MKSVAITVGFILSVLGVFHGFAVGNEQVSQPALQEGDRWTFRATKKEGITSTSGALVGDYEIVFSGGHLEVFEVVGEKKMPATAGNAEQLRRLIPLHQDDLQFLNFPLTVGKKWPVTYRHTPEGATKSQLRSAEFMVENAEQTQTEAGEFRTLRIKGTGKTHGGSLMREWDYFYSPDSKSIVKFHYDSGVGTQSGKTDIELVSFGQAFQDKKVGMQNLMRESLAWLADNTEYRNAKKAEMPGVEWRSFEELYLIGWGEKAKTNMGLGRIWAVYDDERRVILLHDGFDVRNSNDRGRMVHELVHHMQVIGEKAVRCPGASEPEAYKLTEQWFAQNGIALPENWPTKLEVAMMAICSTSKDD